MGVGQRVHTRHRRSGATVVLYGIVWVDQQSGTAPEGGRGFPFHWRDGCPCRRRWRLISLSIQGPYELRKPFRILLVDGYYETRIALSKMLSLCGQTVSVAQDANQSLDLAARRPFDLLTSEVNLPDISGIDLMRELQKVHPIPGIATSAYDARHQEKAVLAAGFDRLLIKPIPITQLIHSINDVMKKQHFSGN